ncbi:GGDEF domain-containing protein [Chelativorans sp. YIM 93263]|uniref:GGDEF domain-containing protein n=1 Tax=Chelativorans sp. YIM 93263 TaxID=2906648 RepID=UPI002378FD67|nr:GGDEF domain-containing protein [Chelativorans sp. YIM 93263]
MKFVPAILLLLFASAFLGLWALERKRRFILTLGAGFASLGLGMLQQVGGVPQSVGLGAVISGFLYTAGVLLVCNGILERSGTRMPAGMAVLYLAGIVGGLWYFYYIDRDLIARIYILNFGLGLIFLHTCWLARFLLRGAWTDKALFFLMAAFGLHFAPRTLLTINSVSRVTTAPEFGRTDFWQTVVLSSSVLGAAGGLGLLFILFVDHVAKLHQERDIDPLTGLLNRRGLERSYSRLARAREARFLAICDLDKFKAINDSYGHPTGDLVLSAFADILRRNMRKTDVVARIGGEEFVLILCDVTEDEALAFSERLRKILENTRFREVAAVGPVTGSFGLARIGAGEPLLGALERADRALYEAKRTGRNRICAEWLMDAIHATRLRGRKTA